MKKDHESSSSSKVERKTIEKNRRILMKSLCFKLVSIIPDDHFKPAKELLSQQEQLEQATDYIKNLTEKLQELRNKKQALMINTDATNKICTNNNTAIVEGLNLPILKIEDLNSSLEVVLISGLCKKFMLHQVISILEEEGTQVVTVNLSNVGDKIFRTLHAQVKVPRVGVDTSKISERIMELFF